MHSRAQLALVRPGPEVTALREVFRELLTDPNIVRRLSDLLSGAENRYVADPDAQPPEADALRELRGVQWFGIGFAR